MGTLKRLLVFALLICISGPLMGCQQFLSKAAEVALKILPILAEAGAVLDAVDLQARSHFRENPDRELEEKYVKAMAKARLALSATARTAEGTNELAGADVEAGFNEYEKAFQEVMAILAPLGVVRITAGGDALQAGEGDGALTIPLPRALSYTAE